MNKYCPICGIENLGEAVTCINCRANFQGIIPTNNTPDQQATYESGMPQYYGQTQQYTPKKSPKKIMSIIAVAAALVISVFLIGSFLADGPFKDIDDKYEDEYKIHVAGGPEANLESIVSGGNALTTPDIGHTAVYGYYMGYYRIGEISFTNMGEETYNGEYCEKIYGNGYLNFDVFGQAIGTDYDLSAFVTKADSILVHSVYSFYFNKPFKMDMEMTLDLNKENGEITITAYSSITGSISTAIEVSDDYWNIKLLEENLYVGYIEEITYITSVAGYETTVTLRISVVGKEDVSVPKGTFEECYRIEIEQTETLTSSTTTQKIWITEDGICPKMEIIGITSTFDYEEISEGMSIELEEYYTT